jgi:hypothetical protein
MLNQFAHRRGGDGYHGRAPAAKCARNFCTPSDSIGLLDQCSDLNRAEKGSFKGRPL